MEIVVSTASRTVEWRFALQQGRIVNVRMIGRCGVRKVENVNSDVDETQSADYLPTISPPLITEA